MLAEHLLKSLDEINPEVESAWNREITDRIEAIDQGTVTLLPASQVLQHIKNR
jgi:hypothetical protein